MDILLFIVVAFVSFFVCMFGFMQIVGSLRTIRLRGVGMSIFTIFIWVLIIFGLGWLVYAFLYTQKRAYWIACGIAFLVSVFSDVGKNGVE